MKVLSLLVVFVFGGLGCWFAMLSVQPEVTSDRQPAAVRAHYDFSKMSPDKRENTLKAHLLRTFEVRPVADKAHFQFGYMSFIDESQTVKTLCSVYSKVVFTFEAEGEAHNGEKPELKITAPCKENGSLAGEVIIPVEAIASSPPGDGDMQFFEPTQMALTFKNIGEHWPEKWYLKGLELNGASGSVSLQDSELNEFGRQAHSFEIPRH